MDSLTKKKPTTEYIPQWQPPTLTYLGKVRDLVKGGGKTGPNFDSDPQSTRKTGVG